MVYELPHDLPNNLRLTILGNKEILGKSQVWVETFPSAQSPFQKLNFGTTPKSIRKSRYQTFLAKSSFTGFLYFVPNILPMIVWANKLLVVTRASVLHTLIFWNFVYHQSISPIFKENIKQFSCVKISNLTVLCKQYFACSI